jgi:hypothetical protein
MSGRNLSLALAALLVAFLGAPAASGTAFAEEAPAASQPAPAAEKAPAEKGSESRGLCREEIFEILKGGAPLNDPGLITHLWNVAGSLACRNWTPPKVTVNVVVAHASTSATPLPGADR